MKKYIVLFALGIVGFSNPTFALAQSKTVDVYALRVQVARIMEQALAVRERIKQMAYESPVQATLASTGQKQVALQVGHWKLEDAPWELRGLDPHRQARGGGYEEWQVNLRIAEETKKLLEQQGIGVTILPAILPSTYKADVFVSIHADQNPGAPWLSGFKLAPSAYDASGKAKLLSELVTKEYQAATGLSAQGYIPSSMTHYYAFNIEKFIYAVHPKTPAVIIETGYLPNPRDRAVIVTNPQMSAAGIANGIVKFFAEQ